MNYSEVKKYNILAKEDFFEGGNLAHSKESTFKLLSPQKGKKILELGCGAGRYLKFFKEKGLLCYGIDISPIQIRKCRKKGLKNVKVWDVQNYPIPFKEKFDYFLISEVLEHLEQPGKALKNVSRKLKPKATGIITSPCFNLPQMKLLISFYRKLIKRDAEKAGHLRIFSERELVRLLNRNFTIERIKYKNCFGEILKARLNLTKDFGIINFLFNASSDYPLRPILKYMGSSIFIKVSKKL